MVTEFSTLTECGRQTPKQVAGLVLGAELYAKMQSVVAALSRGDPSCIKSLVQVPRGFFENADPSVTDPIPNAAGGLKV